MTYSQLLVLGQFVFIGLMLLFSKGGLLSFGLAFIVFLIGLGIGLWALFYNKLGNFNIQPKLKKGSSLITTGIYSKIRHPMYASVTVIMFAVFLTTPTLLEAMFFMALVGILVLKARKEETLWMAHDEAYRDYKKRTKLFIPYIL